jgi:signal transduction histidine kinase
MKGTFTDALILNVDDNEANRYAIGRTLKQAGFRVLEAETGGEVLDRVRKEPPDLVLLDVKLPDISGFEVSRRLKADPATSSVPILQITATYNSSEHWAEALDAGADGYLTHPAEPIVLVATIRALLRAREAERGLREANRLKDEFLATLSHELRTPLNAIVGWAHVLRTPGLDAAVMARAVESIHRNAEAQTRLVADILDVSRIVAGKLRIEQVAVGLDKVVEAAVESLRPSAAARRINLEVRLDAGTTVQGDPSRLQQITSNLLTNAIKFTGSGGTVRVEVRRCPPSAELVVEDTGIGIDPAFLPFVFDRFRQADASMTRSVSGLGLGLALVHDLVGMHGGQVLAESEGKDRGARFTVTLPLPPQAGDAPGPPPPVAVTAGPRGKTSLAGVRILVVDDDTDFLESVQVALESRGAEVSCAGSAEEALKHLSLRVPAVLVSDLGMPEEDGYSLIRQVRTRPPAQGGDVPAVALTAYVADHDRERSLAAGFQMHLGKPVDPVVLVKVIAELAARGKDEG